MVGSILILVLATIGLAMLYIISAIIIKSIQKKQHQQRTASEFFREFFTLLLTLLIIIPATLLLGLFAIAQHFYSNWPVYLSLVGAVMIADIAADHHKGMMETYDHLNTKYWVPFYHVVISEGLTKYLRIGYDLLICWWNLFFQLENIALQEALKVIIDCAFINGRAIAEGIVRTAQSPYFAIVDFVSTKGQGEFDFKTGLNETGTLISRVLDWPRCWCEDASFVWNFLEQQYVNDHLNIALHAFLNIPIDIMREFILFLVELFSNLPTPFTCPPGPPLVRLYCLINRSPKFFRAFDNFVLGTTEFALYADDRVRSVLDIFFSFTSFFSVQTIPGTAFLGACPLNFMARSLEIQIDALVHIDLFFTENYAKHVNITKPLGELYCLSTGFKEGFERLANGTGVPEFNLLGRGLGCLANTSIEVANFTARFLQVIVSNFATLQDFVKEYPVQELIIDQWECGTSNTTAFFKFVNLWLGYTFQYSFKLMEDVVNLFYLLSSHVETIFVGSFSEINDFITDKYQPASLRIILDIELLGVSFGNLFRQIGQFLPSEPCPIVDIDMWELNFGDPVAQRALLNLEIDKEIFCCLGDVYQNFIWGFSGFMRIALELVETALKLRTLTFSFASFLSTFRDHLEFSIDRVEDWCDSLGCTYASPFNYLQCPNIPADTVGFYIRLPITVVCNITATGLSAIRPDEIFLTAISRLLDGVNAFDVICYVIESFYDMMIGWPAQIVYAAQRLLACLIPGIPIVSEIWDLFGWEGSTTALPNIRDEICDVIDKILRLLKFLVNIIISIGGFFGEAIDFLESLFIDGLTAAFTAISSVFTSIFNTLATAIFAVIDDLKVDLNVIFASMKVSMDFIICIVNRIFCAMNNIINMFQTCFIGQIIDINVPPIDIFHADIVGNDVDIVIPFIHLLTFGIINPAGTIACFLQNPFAGPLVFCACPLFTPIPPFPLFTVMKRSEIPTHLYQELLRNKNQYDRHSENEDLYISRSAFKFESNRLASLPKLIIDPKNDNPNELLLLSNYKDLLPIEEQGKFYIIQEDPSYGTDQNITYRDPDIIYQDSPCFPLAMATYAGYVQFDNETGGIRTTFGNETIDSFILQHRFENISATDALAWLQLHLMKELEWCRKSEFFVSLINQMLQLSGEFAIPLDFLYSPMTYYRSLFSAFWRIYHIIRFQTIKNSVYGNITTLDTYGNGTLSFYNETYAYVPGFLNSTLGASWNNYTLTNNITDPLLIKWGSFVDMIRTLADILGYNRLTQLFTDLSGVFSFFTTIASDVWINPDYGILTRSYSERIGIGQQPPLSEFKKRWIAEGKGFFNLFDFKLFTERIKQQILDAMAYAAETNDPTVVKNRYAILMFTRRFRESILLNIGMRKNSYLGSYVRDWNEVEELWEGRKDLDTNHLTTHERRQMLEGHLTKREVKQKKFQLEQRDQMHHHIRNSFLPSSQDQRNVCPFVGEERSVCGNFSLDYCGSGFCLNCIFLQNYIDRMIFEVCECLDATVDLVDDIYGFEPTLAKWGGDPDNYPFPSTFNRPGFINGTSYIQPNGSVIFVSGNQSQEDGEFDIQAWASEAYIRAANIPIVPTPFNLNKLIVNLALYIPRVIFKSFDWDKIRDRIVSFFINENLSSSENVYNIISISLLCTGRNYKCNNRPHLNTNALAVSLLTVYTALIFLSLIGPKIFESIGSIMPYIWLFSFAIVMYVAYRWTEICFITLPVCMMDDIYDVVQSFDVECTPWFVNFPGLTNAQCPTSATDYHRPFIDCRLPPYNFKDGVRNLFVTLEIYLPAVNRFIRSSSSLPAVLLRSSEHVNNALTFPFPSGQVPDDFKSCNKVTTGNWAALLTILAIFSLIAVSFVFAFILFLQVLWAFILLITDGVLDAGNQMLYKGDDQPPPQQTSRGTIQHQIKEESIQSASAPLINYDPSIVDSSIRKRKTTHYV